MGSLPCSHLISSHNTAKADWVAVPPYALRVRIPSLTCSSAGTPTRVFRRRLILSIQRSA